MTYVQQQMNFSGIELRDSGIKTAIEHADAVNDKWSDRAYDLLMDFLQINKRFMGEDVRSYAAEKDFDLPPSARAWGGIIAKAAKNYLIIKIGTKAVKNAKAHCANAAVWERNDERLIEMGLMKRLN